MDAAQTWDETRQRISELALQPGAAETHCPACPEWDVKGVVAHLTGIAAGMVGGGATSASDVNTDEATSGQVADRESQPVEQIVEEWAQYAPGYVERLRDPAAFGMENLAVLLSIMDITAHEHDIRYAIDQPGHREGFGVELGTKILVGGLKGRQAALGLRPLRVEVPGWRTWDIGGEDPATTLTTDQFTLFRTLGGRRSRDQVAALDWTGDADAWVDHVLADAFTFPAEAHEA